MSEIRENRLIPIENKVLSLSNVRELANIVTEEATFDNNTQENKVRFTVKCFDNSSYESSSISLFDDSSILNKKTIRSILIEYRKSDEKYIKIRINHGYIKIGEQYITDSDFEIAGRNSSWVSGVQDKILLSIHSFKNQDTTIHKYRLKALWGAFIIGTYTFGQVIDFLNRADKDFVAYWSGDINSILGKVALASLFGGTILWGVTHTMIEKANDFWPQVEIQIGPDHLLKEKNRRLYYGKLIVLLILPLLLSIISNIINTLY